MILKKCPMLNDDVWKEKKNWSLFWYLDLKQEQNNFYKSYTIW